MDRPPSPRLGPRPLPLHLGTALMTWASSESAWKLWKSGSPNSNQSTVPESIAALLPEIAALFDLYKAEQEKSVDVEVTSAFALNQEQQDKLAKVLSARLNREVRLQVEEDSSLIGGVVIRAGDLVIDGSIRGKIAKLAEALKS